jgi:hypothetical protein
LINLCGYVRKLCRILQPNACVLRRLSNNISPRSKPFPISYAKEMGGDTPGTFFRASQISFSLELKFLL